MSQWQMKLPYSMITCLESQPEFTQFPNSPSGRCGYTRRGTQQKRRKKSEKKAGRRAHRMAFKLQLRWKMKMQWAKWQVACGKWHVARGMSTSRTDKIRDIFNCCNCTRQIVGNSRRLACFTFSFSFTPSSCHKLGQWQRLFYVLRCQFSCIQNI